MHDVHFALYLQHLADTTKSKAAVDEALISISWVHELSGLLSVTESPFVGAVRAGLQRMLAKPRVKKQPIIPDMLRSLVDDMSPKPKLTEVRLVTNSLLAYAAFLHFDELTILRCCDVEFEQDGMSIHIALSKTDQY